MSRHASTLQPLGHLCDIPPPPAWTDEVKSRGRGYPYRGEQLCVECLRRSARETPCAVDAEGTPTALCSTHVAQFDAYLAELRAAEQMGGGKVAREVWLEIRRKYYPRAKSEPQHDPRAGDDEP